MSDFWEKYKDPRWQKKRLEVMQAAGFACQNCGDTTSTLNVHHSIYYRDKSPWEYTNNLLRCLCESCHEDIEELTHDLRVSFARLTGDQQVIIFDIVRFAEHCSLEEWINFLKRSGFEKRSDHA